MDESKITCDYWKPIAGMAACAGHGACVAGVPNEWYTEETSRGVCVCEDGWGGRGDFMNAVNMDCNISEGIVKGCWTAVICMSGACMLYTALVTKRNLETKKDFKKAGFFKILISSIIFNFIRIIEGILRITTYQFIGESVIITLLHSIPGFIFWSYFAPAFILEFLSVLLKQSKMSKSSEGASLKAQLEKLHRLNKFQSFFGGTAFIFFVNLTLISDNPKVLFWVSSGYYVMCLAFGIFLPFVIAKPVTGNFLAMLKESAGENPEPKMEKLIAKLSIFYREINNQGASNAISCLFFLFFSYLGNMQTYQVIFGWFLAPAIAMVAIWILAPAAKKNGKVADSTVTSTTTATATSSTAD